MKPSMTPSWTRWNTVCFAIALSAASMVARGQQTYRKVGYSGEVPIGDLTQMQDSLLFSTVAQQVGLLTRLGVDKEVAAEATKPAAESRIRFQMLTTTGSRKAALLFLPCNDRGAAFADLLEKRVEKGAAAPWRVRDQVALDCWNEVVSYELLSLPTGAAVLIHNTNAGHGSGYLQDDARILMPREGKLAEVLATPEYLSEDISGAIGGNPIEHRSTFTVFPDGSVEETRSTSGAGQLKLIERRLWRWSRVEGRFVAGDFVRVAGEAEPGVAASTLPSSTR